MCVCAVTSVLAVCSCCNHATSACGRPTVPPDLRCSPSVCDRCLRPVSSGAAWLIGANQRLLVPLPPPPPMLLPPNGSNMARTIFLTNSPPPHHLLSVRHCDTPTTNPSLRIAHDPDDTPTTSHTHTHTGDCIYFPAA